MESAVVELVSPPWFLRRARGEEEPVRVGLDQARVAARSGGEELVEPV